MMTLEQVIVLDKASDQTKLLPTTIRFLKEMREVANFGRRRSNKKTIPWTDQDEDRR